MRYSCGIEDVNDLIADLDQALEGAALLNWPSKDRAASSCLALSDSQRGASSERKSTHTGKDLASERRPVDKSTNRIMPSIMNRQDMADFRIPVRSKTFLLQARQILL